MATSDLHLLGTLYTGGIKRLMPTNPTNVGNINAFVTGQAIEVRNTDADNAYRLRWREVVVGAKTLLVADRNILHSVSWDNLNAQGLVAGKEITIDGKQYILRLMTGGSESRGGSYLGGTPTINEWDQIIANEANYAGLPIPVAADLVNGPNTAGAHNQFWNWASIASWAQEVSASSSTTRAVRGRNAARYWDYFSSTFQIAYIGYRPALEVLETTPNISVNINGTQRKAESVHVKVDGAWRKAESIHTNINSFWRKS